MLTRPQVSIRQRASVSSNMDIRNHSDSVNARLGSDTDLANQLESNLVLEPDVGVHIAKGWNAAPKVPAIMVRLFMSMGYSVPSYLLNLHSPLCACTDHIL
jgi:hypothetical protein